MLIMLYMRPLHKQSFTPLARKCDFQGEFFLEFAFFTALYSPLQPLCPIFYFLLGFYGIAAAASVGDGKVNRFAAQIVFVKESLHGEGHFVPPDRADDDDFVILRHVLNALQELWLYIFPLLALRRVEDFFVVAGIVVARVDFKEVCAFPQRFARPVTFVYREKKPLLSAWTK